MRYVFAIVIVCVTHIVAMASTEPATVSQVNPNPIPAPASLVNQGNQLGPVDLENQAHKIAKDLLNGRAVVVRLFRDWGTKPSEFELIRAPIRALTLELGSMKSIIGQKRDSAFVLVLGKDQSDEAVATVLGDFVFGHVYAEEGTLNLWPPWSRGQDIQWWTFVDAFGNPIPKASVEIWVRDYHSRAQIILCTAKLDEQGRLAAMKLGDSPVTFVFTVSHPDYGKVMLELRGGLPDTPPVRRYIAPLVRLDCEAAESLVEGVIVDSDGKPVQDVAVMCTGVKRPDGSEIELHRDTISRAVTDEKGWFAVYPPLETNGSLSSDIIPAGSRYSLTIYPPMAANLRSLTDLHYLAGSFATITLSAIHAGQCFHSFAFEYADGPITNLEEFEKITLILMRDRQDILTLKYNDWKDGYRLPTGLLLARTTRWREYYTFEPIELTPDSPENLTFRPRKPILYTGCVVNGETGVPIPNALVLADRHLDKEPSSLTPQEWATLREEAIRQSKDTSEKMLHQWRNGRLALTDAEGRYKILFMPGGNTSLWSFRPLAEGFTGDGMSDSYLKPDAAGVEEVLPLKLMPLSSISTQASPVLVFEDEAGPVTDANMLKQVTLRIINKSGSIENPLESWLKFHKKFMPGIYYASARWNGKFYIFEPVDLTKQSPDTVVFKPAMIQKEIIFRGRVINGITGEPIAGAIVMNQIDGFKDISGLESEQWAAIQALGPNPDPNDPALAVLTQPESSDALSRIKAVAKTGDDGWFEIAYPSGIINIADILIAVYKDYLNAAQQLAVLGKDDTPLLGTTGRPVLFEPDSDGRVAVPPMKLFPAGTVTFHPVVPDYGQDDLRKIRQILRINWIISGDNKPDWLAELERTPRDNNGASTYFIEDLQENVMQSRYVPAGLELTLKVYTLPDSPGPPITIKSVRLKQGETRDLGKLEFKTGMKVLVKVIDSTGKPLEGIRVYCGAEDWLTWGINIVTNEYGIASAPVELHSKGKFSVVYYNSQTKQRLEESTPYQVAGDEDAGKELVLQLSKKMVRLLKK